MLSSNPGEIAATSPHAIRTRDLVLMAGEPKGATVLTVPLEVAIFTS
jgi:hypothetical protein